MATRREFVMGGLAALFEKGSQPATKLKFEVPAGACDCHVHVFGDRTRYP